jgi:undecaprenyl-diphosphatase
MSWLEAIVLGIIQGITEFLPISSDGHLAILEIAFERLTGHVRTGAENMFINVMLHFGTLTAILAYYRAVCAKVARGLIGAPPGEQAFDRREIVRTCFLMAVATSPLVPLKLFFMKSIEEALKSPTMAAIGFLITATVLLITRVLPGGSKEVAQTTWREALLIGLAQAFAPLPGVSRSGLTIAMALACGFSRTWAVRFSLLIAVPAILGATVSELKDIDRGALANQAWGPIALATLLSAIVGFGAISWLVRVVRSGRLWWFAAYLVVLALVLFGLIYLR